MGNRMTPGMPAKAAAWVVFVLVMAVMTCLTAVVLCFFLPFVVLKALWVLIIQPAVSHGRGRPQKAGQA